MKRQIFSSLLVALAAGAFSWLAEPVAAAADDALRKGIEPKVEEFGRVGGGSGQANLPKGMKPLRASLSHRADESSRQTATRRNVSAQDGMPELYGSVVSANSWTQTSAAATTGMYRIPTVQGGAFEPVSVGSTAPNAVNGGAMTADSYRALSQKELFWTSYYIASFNPETWERISNSASSRGCMAYDLAYDHTTGSTYGCFLKEAGEGYVFGKIDFKTNSVSLIHNETSPYMALAVSNDGRLYGIRAEIDPLSGKPSGSSLYAIDKNSGAATLIGDTGCTPLYNTSAVIDHATGKMYWTVSTDTSGALYEVSLTTGRASKVCDFPDGEQVCGLWIKGAEATSEAPAAVTALSAVFPGGALAGTVSFTAPSKRIDGQPLSGKLDYTVAHGSNVIASGKVDAGASVSVPVSVTTPGLYSFGIKVSNAAGESPMEYVEAFAGKGTPAKPQVTASYSGGMMHVEWTPVTESQNGGYIDPAEVTYRVVRYPSMVVAAEATTATSLDEAIDEPDMLSEFYYTVEASYAGGKSGEAKSNSVVLGAYSLPWSNSLTSPDMLNFWTIIDANDDGRTWAYRTDDLGSAQDGVVIGYNREMPMDDWLVTPPLRLEAGKAYRMTIEFATRTTDDETFEIKLGSAPTAQAMTIPVIEATSFRDANFRQFEGYIVAPESGRYYLGVHACSPANTYRLYVRNLNIAAGESAAGPAAPTDFYGVPDPNGAFRTTLHVTAPETDFNGEPLSELTKLEIIRGGVSVKTFNNPAPGQQLSFTDELNAEGNVEYTAIASNAFGRGKLATTTVFVGINQPAAPTNVKLVETDTPGVVSMTWDAVSTDFRGYPLNPELVTYTIWQLQAETHVAIFDAIDATEFTFRAVEPGDQQMVHYYVTAEAGQKLSPLVDSQLIHCGTPYSLPFVETFKGPGTDTWMGISDVGTATWNVYSDKDIAGLQSVTGDNGFLGSRGEKIGDCSSVYTGKIEIPADFVKPGLMFYTYNLFNDGINDNNEIEISVCDLTAGQTEYTKIGSVRISDLSSTQDWVLAAVPLDAFKGHVIQIDLKTIVANYPLTFIDDISVGTLTAQDLCITGIDAPAEAFANREFTIAATVENRGTRSVDSFRAVLLRDGAEVAAVDVAKPLAPAKSVRVDFQQKFNALQSDGATYRVEVRLPADENPADNVSDDFIVAFKESPLPRVTDLQAGYKEEGAPVQLWWTIPSTDGYHPLPVTDDFEQYDAWAESGVGDWTFVDADGKPVGKITDVTLPEIEWLKPHSWWVMDSSFEQLNASFAAASGKKYLAQMYAVSDEQATQAVPCDDWIISPELTGEAQTVSFKARSYSASYLETFEVLWSDGSTNPADFRLLAEKAQIPAAWSTYSFNLPEGARRFAIRATSFNRFMLFIDDITFIPLSEKNVHIVGYNVWRDGELITPTPVADRTFTDASEKGILHRSTYVVTAVYDKGESGVSNAVTPILSSAGEILAHPVAISAGKGFVQVSGAAGQRVAVFSADGRTLYSAIAADNLLRISLPAGIAMVKAGDAEAKVIVK